MSQCSNAGQNKMSCNCTYEPCSRKGNCCACLRYHLDMNQLPACAFPDDVECSYDRTFRRFAQLYSR
ncbi:MAG: cytosolic protein [Lentisphaerae bacterium]|nr:cytosolic protein [Lentisphaerota bacterium]